MTNTAVRLPRSQSGTESGTESGSRLGTESGGQLGADSGGQFGSQPGTHLGSQSRIDSGSQSRIDSGSQPGGGIGTEAGTASTLTAESTAVAWPRTRVAEVAAAVASVLGLGSAAVSLGWGLGGTFLLDTVGGGIEQAALAATPLALAGVVAAVAIKVVAALLPGWAVSPDGSEVFPSARRRVVRALAWGEALVLSGYGAVMTVGGLLVMTGVVSPAPGADLKAIAWHTFLWDPWFLLWGLAATVALLASRRPRRA
jgi:hypothetical protein